MKSKDYCLQPLDKCDIEAVAKLQKFLWGPNIINNVQHMKWKYCDNPFCKDPIGYTAKKNGNIVGFIGAIPLRWRIGDNILELLTFGDGCIHPDHRGKGLYSKLLKGLIDDVQGSKYYGILNLSNNDISSHVMIKWGSVSLKEIKFFKRIYYYNFFRNTIINTKYKEYCSENVQFSLLPDIDEMLKYDGKMKNSEKIHLFKDISFYNWRFGSKRKQYHFFYNYHDGKLVAYLILLVENQGSARIIDYAYDDSQFFIEIIGNMIKKNHYKIVLLMDTSIDNDLQLVLKKHKIVKDHLYYFITREKSECHITYTPIENSGWFDVNSIDKSDLEDITKWDIKEIASDGT